VDNRVRNKTRQENLWGEMKSGEGGGRRGWKAYKSGDRREPPMDSFISGDENERGGLWLSRRGPAAHQQPLNRL